jgi:glycosyltransferase 2 family protein
VSRAETAATVVVERAFDVLALLLLLFAISPWLPDVNWLQTAAFLLVALGLVLLGSAFLLARWGTRVLRILLFPLSWIPYLSAERFEHVLRNLVQGFVGLHSIRIAIEAFLWTVLSWALVALTFWLVLLGFDFGISPLAGALVVIAINLALVLPSSPAAVGVFEWATVVALQAYGVSDSEALSYALVAHALNFVPFIAAGVLILHREAWPLRRA